MSDRVAAIYPRYALPIRRAGVITATLLGAAVLLLLIVSLAGAAVQGDISQVTSSAAPNLADPLITNPTITETSDYLHADGTTLYYGDGMGTTPQDFWIGGQAQGDDLEVITCTAAFGEDAFDDWTPYDWTCGPYTVESTDSGTVEITATLYNTTGTTNSALFTCEEDAAAPVSVADSPAYNTASPIPVTFTVAADLSGLDYVRLYYRYGETWAPTHYTSTASSGVFNFVPADGDGTYYFATVAKDNVGNVEDEPSGNGQDSTIYDTHDPSASVSSPAVSTELSWLVSWGGSDPAPGSGIASYDVQYQVESDGWQDWMMGTALTSYTFGPDDPVWVEFEHTYYFRVRARDQAGREGEWSSAATYVDYKYVYLPLVLSDYSPLTNGGFEDGWVGWAHGGALRQSIISSDGWSGPHSGAFAARLGDPTYACNGGVPLGTAWVERTITVPRSGVSSLRIWYRIYSQDYFSEPYYDRFQVLLNGGVVHDDGNVTAFDYCNMAPISAGWEVVDVDVTGYLGQNITLRLENVSDFDNWYNTWTYVDDIQFVP